jgi:hypothetical protein
VLEVEAAVVYSSIAQQSSRCLLIAVTLGFSPSWWLNMWLNVTNKQDTVVVAKM